MTRKEAWERWGIPTYVGHAYGPGEQPRSTSMTLLSAEHPEYIVETLFGIDLERS